jgi:PhzF family phenazine biosynthesis protein
MKIPQYQVDAFTSKLFGGNPAAVCPLDSWLPDSVLQSIAAENNLSETAFYVPEGSKYRLRWFTPQVEVDLCGHATLATAHVMFEMRKELDGNLVLFTTKSGELAVDREDGRYVLDFPSRPPQQCEVHPDLVAALGATPVSILAARDYCCVFENEDQVRALLPDMQKLMNIDRFAVIVTALGSDFDFVSRFFAPAKGVPEDPVTGSAHCTLIPYWSQRLNKTSLFARQVSARGGELWCANRGERVRIGGHAVAFAEGFISVPE